MAEIGKDILKAKELLVRGELVGIPTETVYGLAGNALDINSVAKIFQVKDRPQFDPLIVHVSDFSSVNLFVSEIPDQAKRLAKAFWPGPMTLLLKRKQTIPDLVTSGLDTVGIRCPNHPLTIQLLQSLPFPLAAPSANPFGYISPTKASHVNDQLGSKINYILDGGESTVGIESTIIGFEADQPTIYRLGGLSLEDIKSVVGSIHVQLHSVSNPRAPGQLASHYAPTKKLILGNIPELLSIYGSSHVGLLSFQNIDESVDPTKQRVLTSSGDLLEAAQNLFASLRELDQLNIKIILAEQVPEIGLGRAINDRLRRASFRIAD